MAKRFTEQILYTKHIHSYIYNIKLCSISFLKNYVMMINHFSKGYLIVVYNCKFLTSIERGREQRQG